MTQDINKSVLVKRNDWINIHMGKRDTLFPKMGDVQRPPKSRREKGRKQLTLQGRSSTNFTSASWAGTSGGTWSTWNVPYMWCHENTLGGFLLQAHRPSPIMRKPTSWNLRPIYKYVISNLQNCQSHQRQGSLRNYHRQEKPKDNTGYPGYDPDMEERW